jgi:DNA polymerase-1
MLLQVHDELIFDMHPDEESQLKVIVTKGMIDALKLACLIEIDMGTGNNWLEAH